MSAEPVWKRNGPAGRPVRWRAGFHRSHLSGAGSGEGEKPAPDWAGSQLVHVIVERLLFDLQVAGAVELSAAEVVVVVVVVVGRTCSHDATDNLVLGSSSAPPFRSTI